MTLRNDIETPRTCPTCGAKFLPEDPARTKCMDCVLAERDAARAAAGPDKRAPAPGARRKIYPSEVHATHTPHSLAERLSDGFYWMNGAER